VKQLPKVDMHALEKFRSDILDTMLSIWDVHHWFQIVIVILCCMPKFYQKLTLTTLLKIGKCGERLPADMKITSVLKTVLY